jgi:dTDP-4-amino-4,6-dideoxygalactose transaminase
MTDVQAAVGLTQLKKLDVNRERRSMLAKSLSDQLAEIDGLALPEEKPHTKHGWFGYSPVLIDRKKLGMDRDELLWRLLTQKGIRATVNYTPVHLEDCYLQIGHRKGECPVAEEFSERVATLPLYTRLSFDDIDYMASSIKDVVRRSK